MKELNEIVEPLLTWYAQNKRSLPWREEIHPYKTWVSEIMLQQTRVEAVKEYFTRFLTRLPDMESLSTISEEELLKLWEGLGYYNRVRNMQKMAQVVMEKYHGIIPSTYDEIIALPGIGPYTAGAILSIAYQKKIPCVDGNVLRVLSRLLCLEEDISKESTKKNVHQLLLEILPENVGDFNQALMELGALICVPNGEPSCEACPLSFFCQAAAQNRVGEFPKKEQKKSRTVEAYTVFLLEYQHKIKIEKRETSILKGLYQLPNTKGHLTESEVKAYLKKQGYSFSQVTYQKEVQHIFTHQTWNMILYKVELLEPSDGLFVSTSELEESYPLPTAFAKLLKEKRGKL